MEDEDWSFSLNDSFEDNDYMDEGVFGHSVQKTKKKMEVYN